MAMNIGSSDAEDEVMSAINTTPLVDVMLVLLIIFMVAAPLATVDIAVDLPASTATPAPRPQEPLYLTLQQDLSIHICNDPVARETLGPTLDRVTSGDKERRIFLRADQTVGYGQFMTVMNLLRDAGYLKIALVGLEAVPQQPEAAPAPAEAAPQQPEAKP